MKNIPDFRKLEKLHNLCRQLAISWSMEYGEGDYSFCFCTHSPAEKENYITRSMGYEFALNDVIEFLESLKGEIK